MPWFRVDDDFALHPKAVAAGNTALGLWVRAGAYAAQYLTEGYVPAGMLAVLGGKPRDAKALVDAGLWRPVDGGWRFHQWEERQPTRAQVEKDRRDAVERQKRARQRAKEARGVTPDVTRDDPAPVTRDSRSPRPGPARPGYLLTLVSRLAASDAHGSEPPPAEVISAWQDHAGPTVDLEAEAAAYLRRFGDRPASDERGAWLGWLTKARQRATEAAATTAAADRPTPVPATPTCPIHPDQPTGSKACPRCAADAIPTPGLRQLREAQQPHVVP